MKKFFTSLFLISILFSITSCGGGSGSSSSPPGEDPDVPFSVKLRPSQYVVQTNGFIYMNVRVLNGNGNPISNIPVTFTNLSSLGTLIPTSANTDGYGYAEVRLSSTTSGFATVQAEVNNGTGKIRDRKTVYFSTYSLVLLPYMYLEVDGNDADAIYDEPEDFNLFEPGAVDDDSVTVRATVFDRYGQTEFGSVVTFGADSTEASFPLGNIRTTNAEGQASVLVQVDASVLRSSITILNITASADNGAAGMVTLFLEPVVVSSVTVSADPTSVETGGTSTITAAVTLNTGASAPDGTTVSFTTTCGTVTPFAQTTGGVATATFTAPEVTADTTATITASVGGKSDSVVVTITAPVTPPPTPTPDTTSPTVSSTIPANGDIGVAHPTPVTITFSENIDCSTVTSATVTITPSVTWNLTSCTGNTVVFNGATLANTSYTVNVGTGVKDLAGNVAVASVFSFTTEP